MHLYFLKLGHGQANRLFKGLMVTLKCGPEHWKAVFVVWNIITFTF